MGHNLLNLCTNLSRYLLHYVNILETSQRIQFMTTIVCTNSAKVISLHKTAHFADNQHSTVPYFGFHWNV